MRCDRKADHRSGCTQQIVGRGTRLSPESDDRAMILLDITAAFDGLVIIKTIHDSTPTPTGERRAKKK